MTNSIRRGFRGPFEARYVAFLETITTRARICIATAPA